MGLYRIEYQIYSHSGNSETLIDSGYTNLEWDGTLNKFNGIRQLIINNEMRQLILDKVFKGGDPIKSRIMSTLHKIECCDVRIVSAERVFAGMNNP